MDVAVALPDHGRMVKGPYKKRMDGRAPGNTVRQWRLFNRLTQAQLAEAADLSVPTISNIETGATGWTSESMGAIAAAFNCSIADLIDRDPAAVSLAGRVADLNADQQAMIAALLDAHARRGPTVRIIDEVDEVDEADLATPRRQPRGDIDRRRRAALAKRFT